MFSRKTSFPTTNIAQKLLAESYWALARWQSAFALVSTTNIPTNMPTFTYIFVKTKCFLAFQAHCRRFTNLQSKHSTLFRHFMWVVFTFATTQLGFSVVAMVCATSFYSTLENLENLPVWMDAFLFLCFLAFFWLLLPCATTPLCQTLRVAHKYAENAIYPHHHLYIALWKRLFVVVDVRVCGRVGVWVCWWHVVSVDGCICDCCSS